MCIQTVARKGRSVCVRGCVGDTQAHDVFISVYRYVYSEHKMMRCKEKGVLLSAAVEF